MDQLATLAYAIEELRQAVASLDESQMDMVTNCAPWTVRQLASHALNNQLVWAGLVNGQELVSFADTMAAVPYEGDLTAYADHVADQSMALWATGGVLETMHVTPFGEVPGSVVITFSIIDGIAHAWDLSASVGRALEFEPHVLPEISAVVEATCTDDVVALGLIQAPTQPPPDATETEVLMAKAGRTIRR